jgi:hypothetical protein
MSLLTRKVLDAPIRKGFLMDYLAQPGVAPVWSVPSDPTLGVPVIVASVAVTFDPMLVASTAAVAVAGRLTKTLGSMLVASTAGIRVKGSLEVILGAMAISATATVALTDDGGHHRRKREINFDWKMAYRRQQEEEDALLMSMMMN